MTGAHPASFLFPMMAPEELQELADDIKSHGLIHPVVLHEGLVLDGRNRLKACEIAGVVPHFDEWKADGVSPTEWVIATNLRRRHLTTAQRAVIAVEALPMLQAEARERQRKAGEEHGAGHPKQLTTNPVVSSTSEPLPDRNQRTSIAAAGRMVSISGTLVQDTKAIKEKAPETYEKMKDGSIQSVYGAQKESGLLVTSRQPKRSTGESDDSKLPRSELVANANLRRFVVGLSTVVGTCGALKDVKYDLVIAAASAADVDVWISQIRTASKELHNAERRLKGEQN